MNTYRILVAIGSMMLVVGARLPWMSVPILYGVEGHVYEAIEIGWEDNGFVTGGIGLVLLLGGLLCMNAPSARYSILGLLLAGVAHLVVIGCFYSILKIAPEAGFLAATDVGIYVTFLGSLLALAGVLGAVFGALRGSQGSPSRLNRVA